MVSLKTLAVAGVLAAAATMQAHAADLGLPPAPGIILPAPPATEPSGWYLRGDVGVGAESFDKPSYTNVASGTTVDFLHKSMDSPAFVGIGVGYQANAWLRGDITAEYRGRSSLSVHDNYRYGCTGSAIGDTCAGGGFNNINSSLTSIVALANAYVDLGTWYGLTPFIGAGIGVTRNSFGSVTDMGAANYAGGTIASTGLAGPLSPASGTARGHVKTNLAWALHAGVAYDINPHLKLELAYRYLNLGDGVSGNFNCYGGCGGYTLKAKNIDSHDFKIGMRWMLGDTVADAAPPAPLVRKY